MNRPLDKINFDSQRAQFAGLCPGRVVVVETGNNLHQQLLCSGRHVMLADRSPQDGGEDTGPDPRQLMLMALGSHLSMTLRAKADERGWPVEQILVRFDAPSTPRHQGAPWAGQLLDLPTNCTIELIGDLDHRQQAQLVELANRQLTGRRWLPSLDRATHPQPHPIR